MYQFKHLVTMKHRSGASGRIRNEGWLKQILLLTLPLLAVALAACGAGSPSSLAVTNGIVIDGSGDPPIENGTVLIEDGVILEVGTTDEVEIPSGAQVIDANGGAIMPGLVDAHTHVLERINLEDGEIGDIGRIQYLEKTVEAGVTSFRDVGSHYQTQQEISELGRALDALGNNAPRLVFTGPLLLAPGSWGLQFGGQPAEVADVGEASSLTASLITAGVDQIKMFMDPGQLATPTLTEAQVNAIVEIAHDSDYWVTAHAVRQQAQIAVAAGVDELAHWPSGIQVGASIWQVPDSLMEDLVAAGIPVVTTFNIMPPYEDDVRSFLDSGGTLAFGTDGPGTGPLYLPTREFRLMRLFGMTNMEILVAATRNSASVIGLGDQVGLLQPGMQADVIVIDGNPLEDIMVMDEVAVVIRGGEMVFSESGDG